MSALDKNKIFFGLIHYILSEQSNVDWILKTSLVNFTGINSTVDNKKYKQNSLTNDIIEYIYQVKPYHVTFEQFIEKYSSEQDEVNISTQDQNNITMNIRFDAITSNVDEQGNMNDYEYMDTHMANRLWYFKHASLRDVYKNDEAIHDYIKDVMNCHFKGITVDGSGFNIDKSGYDAFLYDSTLYDAPTLSADYCLVDYTEDIKYPYIKKIIKVGLKSLQLEHDKEVLRENLTIYSDYNGNREEIKDFTIKDNIITFFTMIRQYEKITIINTVNKVRNAWVFLSHPFIESDADTNIRQFVAKGTTSFPIPDGNLGSRKVTVHIEYPNGSRIPTTNYEKNGSNIVIFDKLEENYHVVLTVIDYKQIYDKIYTYEDCYGQSNNVIALDGDKFLRPYYEKERPSELCVSYPIHNLMIYTNNSNGDAQSVYNADFKDTQYKLPLSKTMTTKLSQDLKAGDRIIEVDNISKLTMPYKGNNSQIVPGKIIVNSEIIEFFEFEKLEGNKGILKSIRRGASGSYLAELHKKGSIVYSYNSQLLVDCTSTAYNLSTYVRENTENKFRIPGEYREDYKLAVFKKSHINLLSDITYIGKHFDISSNNITLPGKVSLESQLEFVKLHKNQILAINVGGTVYELSFDYDYDDLNELIKFISSKISTAGGFSCYNVDNKINMVATEGKSIKVYNVKGEPLQELFGNVIHGNKENPTIWMDGYNGLTINGFDLLWGSDSRAEQWMIENPSKGTIEDVINTINNSDTVNKIVKAYNRNGYLEIVSLTNKEVIIETLTNMKKPIDNMKELGIDTVIKTQEYFLNEDELSYYYDTPDKLGNIFIEDEKLYFRNIQRMVDGKNLYYRISNYYTNKEYKAGQSYIFSIKPEQLDSSKYTIHGDEDYVVLNEAPLVGEIVTISNEK